MKVARIATVPFFLNNHLRQQIIDCSKAGFEIVLVSSAGPEVEELKKIEGVRYVELNIEREISVLNDLVSLIKMYFVLRRERFDIIHSTTPKAGIITAIAGLIARVPIRIHTFTGQAWAETHGLKRIIAKLCDKITIYLSTCCYADSASQLEYMVNESVTDGEKIKILGAGSLAGVNLQRFSKKSETPLNSDVLNLINIPSEQIVITFIGRITKDKGVKELVTSFAALCAQGLSCKLLLIGPEEKDAQEIYRETRATELQNIHILGYQSSPEHWLAVTDIFCIPSYREGFGNVVIEAGAMGVPTVGTEISGLRDAVVNNVTGILVPPKNVEALTIALRKLIEDKKLRSLLGQNACIRAQKYFDSCVISDLLIKDYLKMVQAIGS